ncbi:Os09g0436600 [Oryza sativa Japonica Group]|uniref:Os09g0436600 protein n=1 Tax=Oryza sativa subsp. japonica TaxID=39947 RepID=A0A0P0XML8_ORYSJ|nr:hypothetical protein EE612_048066 [Oryza sativa]BAT08253.1 Os09g0436600 [Oryza sativa Japonica Group]
MKIIFSMLPATAVDPVTPSSILVAIAASYCFLFPTASSLLTPILWHIMVGKVCGRYTLFHPFGLVFFFMVL